MIEPVRSADLLLAYDWPYDRPFVQLLREVFARHGLDLLAVSPETLDSSFADLLAGRVRARAFLDRASDTDRAFLPLESWAAEHIPLQLNPGQRRRQVWIKTNLHWDFIAAGIHTPHTLAIPSLKTLPELPQKPDLTPLGVPFSIKPDLGGGGWGVVTDAAGWEDVEQARKRHPEEALILQAFIEPTLLDGRRAWFRVLYACGAVFPCWWSDRERVFGPPVSAQDREALGLQPLWDITQIAARIAGLQLISCEIARVEDGRFIVVDYANDPVDLRFQPHAREGMPAGVARELAEAIARFLRPSAGQPT
jgi:hypothetical protein